MKDKKLDVAAAMDVNQIEAVIKMDNEAQIDKVRRIADMLLGGKSLEDLRPDLVAPVVAALAQPKPAGDGGCGFCGCC
jgi:hypothetical protein